MHPAGGLRRRHPLQQKGGRREPRCCGRAQGRRWGEGLPPLVWSCRRSSRGALSCPGGLRSFRRLGPATDKLESNESPVLTAKLRVQVRGRSRPEHSGQGQDLLISALSGSMRFAGSPGPAPSPSQFPAGLKFSRSPGISILCQPATEEGGFLARRIYRSSHHRPRRGALTLFDPLPQEGFGHSDLPASG